MKKKKITPLGQFSHNSANGTLHTTGGYIIEEEDGQVLQGLEEVTFRNVAKEDSSFISYGDLVYKQDSIGRRFMDRVMKSPLGRTTTWMEDNLGQINSGILSTAFGIGLIFAGYGIYKGVEYLTSFIEK